MGLSLGVSDCTPRKSGSLPEEVRLDKEAGVDTYESASPHVLASLQLMDQARILLEGGRPDDAITVLERAISLNPSNGQNYYYLAEAWLLKKALAQAKEFNRLAGIHLTEDTGWTARVMEQRERIQRVSDNVEGLMK